MKKSPTESAKNHLILAVKVVPKAHRNEIVGWENDALKVRIKAVPVKGEANDELIAFLAKTLNIAPSRLTLLTKTGRQKRLRIDGVTKSELDERVIGRQNLKESGARMDP